MFTSGFQGHPVSHYRLTNHTVDEQKIFFSLLLTPIALSNT